MIQPDDRNGLFSRRDLLATGFAALGALALGGRFQQKTFADAASPFKLGLQSYSLRGLVTDGKPDFDKALKALQELGIHYIESYTAHIPMIEDSSKLGEYLDKAKAADVAVIGYGVLPFTKNHDANRKAFEFAKRLDLGYISADPDPDSFDSLDKLVDEYNIPIGIHNHGPTHRYGKIEQILKAIKDHSDKIGCCVDTGHFLLARENPVEAVEVFGKRVYGVHLKDVKDATTFTILGDGDLKTVDLFNALAKLKYDKCLAIEYEESPENPIADIKACVAEAKRAMGKMSS